MKLKIVYKRKLKSSIKIDDDIIYLKVDRNNYINIGMLGDDINSIGLNYDSIIAKAIELNLSKLNLDLFGVLALSKGDAYNVATSTLERYLSNTSKMKIYLNIYNDYIDNYKMLRCSALKGDECYIGMEGMDMPYMPKSLKYSITLNKIFDLSDTAEMFIPLDDIKSPMSFIDSYMADKKIKKGYLYSNGFDKDDCSKCRCNKKCFTKVDCYRASIVLGFNRTEVLQLLSYGGYAFNPNDSLDIWFNEYLLDNDLASNMADFIDRYYDNSDILDKIFNGQ